MFEHEKVATASSRVLFCHTTITAFMAMLLSFVLPALASTDFLVPPGRQAGPNLVVVDLKFASQKSAEEKEGRKHSQTACPRACVVIRSFMTGAIIKDGHARIIIMRPETTLH
jgi:hypothetical protein